MKRLITKTPLVLIILLYSTVVYSHFNGGSASFSEFSDAANLDELQYEMMLNDVEYMFKDQLAAMGKKLVLKKQWRRDEARAYMTRDDLNNPVLIVYGGMARHHLMTKDAFMLFLCHEMGHYLGGWPKARRGNSNKFSWSSNEGQSDYFATSKCLKRFFKAQPEDTELPGSTSDQHTADVVKICKGNELCSRLLHASITAAKVIADIRLESSHLQLFNKDPSKVNRIYDGHARSQCRLDTMVAGALCPVSEESKVSDSDYKKGYCHRRADSVKSEYARPRCWFIPPE